MVFLFLVYPRSLDPPQTHKSLALFLSLSLSLCICSEASGNYSLCDTLGNRFTFGSLILSSQLYSQLVFDPLVTDPFDTLVYIYKHRLYSLHIEVQRQSPSCISTLNMPLCLFFFYFMPSLFTLPTQHVNLFFSLTSCVFASLIRQINLLFTCRCDPLACPRFRLYTKFLKFENIVTSFAPQNPRDRKIDLFYFFVRNFNFFLLENKYVMIE